MKLSNLEIYNYSIRLVEAFKDSTQYLPIKLNFIINKNIQTLTTLAEEIEQSRYKILQHYGTMTDNGIVTPIEENQTIVLSELKALFEIEQEVNIIKIKNIEDFGNLSLSIAQMNAIMFMIEEE